MRHARSLGDWERQIKELESENQALRAGKDEAEQTLDAIRRGEVDALIVNTPEGQRLFTLEGAERPYRALIEQMQQGAATLSQDGTIHYANRAFANMLNRPLETLIGTRMEPCIQGPDRPAFAAMLGECGPGGTHREVSLCAKPGGVLPVLLSLSRVGQAVAGDIYMMVVTNLSERKQTEQVLASAKFAWAILAQAEGAIMVFDPGRRLAFANSAARRLAGLDPAGSERWPSNVGWCARMAATSTSWSAAPPCRTNKAKSSARCACSPTSPSASAPRRRCAKARSVFA